MRENHIAILTQPPCGNYGGMLQAYAMQQILFMMGYTSEILPIGHRESLLERIRQVAHKAKLMLFRRFQTNDSETGSGLSKHQMTTEFISQFLTMADAGLLGTRVLFSKKKYDRFIIGSDQIWRASYLRYFCPLDYFFLSFSTEYIRNRSFSYSASFGTDEWEGTEKETEECRALVKQFRAVSVREISGVSLCKELFHVDSVRMPDPTLLLLNNQYEPIIHSNPDCENEPYDVAAYILCLSRAAENLLHNLRNEKKKKVLELMPCVRNDYSRYLSVGQWLRGIQHSKNIVTDSFHGCVFSIIYNKPFVCLGNASLGSARFDTLFQVFGLEDRLVTSRDPEEVLQVLRQPIDWKRVNAIREAERSRGLDFLRSNLYDEASPHEHK